MIDLHSHLLPGVDDGSRSVEQSVAVLTRMAEAGVTAVCLTPHLNASRAERGVPAAHDAAFGTLRAAAPANPTLHRGVELMLDRPFPAAAAANRALTLGGSRCLLVEFTRMATPEAVYNALAHVAGLGLLPLLAHPERYACCTPQVAATWKATGALLQVDANTLFMPRTRGDRARALVANGLADILAADNHGDARDVSVPYVTLVEAGGERAGRSPAGAESRGDPRRPEHRARSPAGAQDLVPLAAQAAVRPGGLMQPETRIQAEFAALATLAAATAGQAPSLLAIATCYREAVRSGHTLFFAGNGGSAADAQHVAAEYVVRLRKSRRALAAVALTVDTSVLTAAGNDLGFEQAFARQVEALGRAGDVLVLHSTSGESANLLAAARAGRTRGMKVVAFLGRGGGRLLPLADLAFVVASDDTSRIQEIHLAAEHAVASLVEEEGFA